MGNFESYTQETAQYVIDNLQIYEKGAETAQNLRISGPDTVYIPDFSEVLSYGYQAGLENPVFGTAETAEGVSWTAEGPAGVSIDPVTGRLSVARGTEPGGSVTVTAELAEERASTTVLLAPNTPEYTGIDLFRYQDQSAAARVAVRKPQAEESLDAAGLRSMTRTASWSGSFPLCVRKRIRVTKHSMQGLRAS